MPYFPLQEESSYTCRGCDLKFIQGSSLIGCCVIHAPGACCHYGEQCIVGVGPKATDAGQYWGNSGGGYLSEAK